MLLLLLFTLVGCDALPETMTEALSETTPETEPEAQPDEGNPSVAPAAVEPACPSGVEFSAAPLDATYQAVIERDVQALTAFWQAEYSTLGGGAYPGVCHVVEYEPQTAPFLDECGLDADRASQNAFYCSTVNAVMWDGPTFYHPIYTELGDAAVTFITAHEFGHSAQVLSGTLPSTSVNAELQADCYAGAYLNYLSDQGILSQEDAREVILIVFAIGQSRIGSTWQTRTHGTSAQRQIAVQRGFQQGVEGCIDVDFSELIDDVDRPRGPRRP